MDDLSLERSNEFIDDDDDDDDDDVLDDGKQKDGEFIAMVHFDLFIYIHTR